MSVERLPSGGWRARWRDARGNPQSKGRKEWRKRDAQAYERKMLAMRDKGIIANAGNLTVSELADQWLEASRHLAESSRKSYRQALNADILPVLGDIKLAKLSSADIDDYISTLDEAGRATSTQRRHRNSILSPMMTFARKRNLIAVSPVTDVKAPKLETVEKRFLTMEELKTLSEAFPERWQALIIFAGIMGPRPSEMLRMRPEHVDGQHVLIPGTKSKTSLRRITMPGFIHALVQEQMETWPSPTALWPSRYGRRVALENWRSAIWYPSLKRADIGHMRIHDLRHTAAALAIKAGAHPLLIQRRLGHASITVTLGIYGHLFPEADGPVADGLDKMWEG